VSLANLSAHRRRRSASRRPSCASQSICIAICRSRRREGGDGHRRCARC